MDGSKCPKRVSRIVLPRYFISAFFCVELYWLCSWVDASQPVAEIAFSSCGFPSCQLRNPTQRPVQCLPVTTFYKGPRADSHWTRLGHRLQGRAGVSSTQMATTGLRVETGGSPKENQTWLLEKVGKINISLLGLFWAKSLSEATCQWVADLRSFKALGKDLKNFLNGERFSGYPWPHNSVHHSGLQQPFGTPTILQDRNLGRALLGDSSVSYGMDKDPGFKSEWVGWNTG